MENSKNIAIFVQKCYLIEMNLENPQFREKHEDLSPAIVEMVMAEEAYLKHEKEPKTERGGTLLKTLGVLTLAAVAMTAGMKSCQATSENLQQQEKLIYNEAVLQGEKENSQPENIQSTIERAAEKILSQSQSSFIAGGPGWDDASLYLKGNELTRRLIDQIWVAQKIKENPGHALYSSELGSDGIQKLIFRGYFTDSQGLEKKFEVTFKREFAQFEIQQDLKLPSEFGMNKLEKNEGASHLEDTNR